jgi:hypothetical protein
MNILNVLTRLRDDIKTWVTNNINNLNTKINNKLDSDALPGAINEAITQAKESGEFDGPQSDWNQTDDTQADYIKNKPDLETRVQRMSEIDKASWEEDNSDIPDDWIDREVTFTIDVEAAKAAGYGDVLENITNTNQLTLTKPKGIGFVYDYNAKHSYRVYTELSRDRGTYNKIVTSTSGAPVFDPDGYDWAWSEYVKDADGNDTIKPANGAIPLYPKGKMNSIVLRQNNGNVSVPYVPHEGASAASKYYVDTQTNESKTYTDTKGDEIKTYVDSKIGNYANAIVETKTGNLIVLDDINPSTSNISVHSSEGGTPIRVSGSNFAYEDTIVAKGSTSWYSSSILIYPPKGHKYILTCDFKKIAGTKVGIAVKPDDNSRDWYREIGSSDTEGSLSLEVDVGAYKKYTSLKFYSNYSGSAAETECIFSNIVFRLADMEVESGTKGIQSVNYTTNADGNVVVSVPDVSPMLIYNIDDVELSATYSKDINKHFTTVENVEELPASNINTNKIYNLFSATFIHNRHVVDNSKCYIVDNRPTIGEPATNLERNAITAYYDLSDGKVYGYLDEILAAGFSQLAGTTIVAGWYPAEQLLPIAGWSYAGVIDNIGGDPNDSTIRVLLEKKVYIYQNEWIELTNSIVEERLPTPDNNGHFAYTVQRRDGVDAYELHLISHAINVAYQDGVLMYPYQIPLRENGIIKAATPIEDLDVANKAYVDNSVPTEEERAQWNNQAADISFLMGTPTDGLSYVKRTYSDIEQYECSGIGTATSKNIIIPSEIDGIPVTHIGYEAFRSNKTIESIVIPDTVTKIEDYAFRSCSNLKSIVVSKNLTYIGRYAFDFCPKLQSITIPNSVTTIEEEAFSSCSNLTICCEAKTIPSGWNSKWNKSNRPVVWDYIDNFVGINTKRIEEHTDYFKKIDITSTSSGGTFSDELPLGFYYAEIKIDDKTYALGMVYNNNSYTYFKSKDSTTDYWVQFTAYGANIYTASGLNTTGKVYVTKTT